MVAGLQVWLEPDVQVLNLLAQLPAFAGARIRYGLTKEFPTVDLAVGKVEAVAVISLVEILGGRHELLHQHVLLLCTAMLVQADEPLVGYFIEVLDLLRWNDICQNHFLLSNVLLVVAIDLRLGLLLLRPRVSIDVVALGGPELPMSGQWNLHFHRFRLSFDRHRSYNNYNNK